jgi:hypothetical protein
MSEELSALRQMMRLRGFSLMTNIMDDYEKDLEILMLVRFQTNLVTIDIYPSNKLGYRLYEYMAFNIA